ncbi:GlxA family transcriptional regulator [Trinickia fusca]|uniref:Helix-turn-helix domain-containing protein n=1 Tax=Trinickia fusca TaxID=2419777 RepID=A0A494XS12_9BURK|nr:helix-turn-helix domain-containing protein [Trinickia fusca]RKP50914.1 helix-turn-helix domain-containing protein [Trinickia fusca]
MPYASIEPALMGWLHAPAQSIKCATRRIAIVLFDDCALLGTGLVAEVFHVANELVATSAGDEWIYDVSFLSARGGNVTCSSSVRVWTDGLDARHYSGFDALFIAGGKGARAAAGDERLIGWLRRVETNTAAVRAIDEGREVLDAAGIANRDRDYLFGSYLRQTNGEVSAAADTSDRLEPMKGALAMVKRDLGLDIARSVAERMMPGASSRFVPLLGDAGAATAGDKIRAAARWLQENCERPISIADAAQVAAMSERNFLRRFKLELGMTPSDYLLQARLAITCSLLIDSELPVDKIARRSGMGNGDRLAKIFRKRMMISPTEFRMQSRREAGG